MEQNVIQVLSQIVANNAWSAIKVTDEVNKIRQRPEPYITPYQVDRVLENLVGQGYVAYRKDGNEPRVYSLTSRGKDLVRAPK